MKIYQLLNQQRPRTVLVLLAFLLLETGSSQIGIRESLKISDERKSSMQVWGLVEVLLNQNWLKICIQGEISIEYYTNSAQEAWILTKWLVLSVELIKVDIIPKLYKVRIATLPACS